LFGTLGGALAGLLAGCVPKIVAKAQSGDAAAIKQLLAAKPVSQDTKNEALVEAVMAKRDAAIGALLDGGADPAAKDELGAETLTIAIRKEDAVAVALLLSHKADVASAVDVYKLAQRDVAEALIAGGADPNAKDSEGATPLAVAACDGKTDLVKLWLAHGAVPAKAGKACLRSHFDIESIKPACDDYATAFECAKAKGFAEIQKLLEAAGKP